MKIYIATDHAGFELKEKLVPWLKEFDYEVVDKGAYVFEAEDDYPDFIYRVAKEISDKPEEKGIILGGSGEGEAICANRLKNVRAVVYYGGNPEIVKLSREHNDANILALGARFVDEDEAKRIIKMWLGTDFSNEERHVRRLKKIEL